ncbi:hypothetical protein AB0B45_19005 [Nonomuraea sp. NPDC049152]|uniref:hypothetical protein n=1 Tax=Nonomuraea sp. NPDC049152 TaxID=3154350 RepID=UPI0033CB554C
MRSAYAAIAWTGLYVASKVHFALEGRLGVTGGPRVSPQSYQPFGPGEVALAQWANAACGLVVVVILLAGRLPLRGRWPRVVLSASHWVCTAAALVGAVGMLGGALLTDRGGAVFGGYCAVWAALLFLATRDLRRRAPRPSGRDLPSSSPQPSRRVPRPVERRPR